jgi:hypothetical protein
MARDEKPASGSASEVPFPIREDAVIPPGVSPAQVAPVESPAATAEPAALPAPASTVGGDFCGALYDVLGKVLALGGSRFFHLSYAEALPVFAFTSDEKATLVGPTSAVLNKFMSEWLLTHQDEGALFVLLGVTLAPKFSVAAKLAQEKRKPQEKPAAEVAA